MIKTKERGLFLFGLLALNLIKSTKLSINYSTCCIVVLMFFRFCYKSFKNADMKQHKYWKNEFGDLVFFDGGDLTYSRWCITIDGKYDTSKGGLNQAKKHINDYRGKKTNFKKIEYAEL